MNPQLLSLLDEVGLEPQGTMMSFAHHCGDSALQNRRGTLKERVFEIMKEDDNLPKGDNAFSEGKGNLPKGDRLLAHVCEFDDGYLWSNGYLLKMVVPFDYNDHGITLVCPFYKSNKQFFLGPKDKPAVKKFVENHCKVIEGFSKRRDHHINMFDKRDDDLLSFVTNYCHDLGVEYTFSEGKGVISQREITKIVDSSFVM